MYSIGNGTGARAHSCMVHQLVAWSGAVLHWCSAAHTPAVLPFQPASVPKRGPLLLTYRPPCHQLLAAAGAKKLGQKLSMKGRSSSRDREGSDTSSAQPSPVL